MSNIRANSYEGKGHVSPFNFFSNYGYEIFYIS